LIEKHPRPITKATFRFIRIFYHAPAFQGSHRNGHFRRISMKAPSKDKPDNKTSKPAGAPTPTVATVAPKEPKSILDISQSVDITRM
jgi:hypothetical protein